MNCIAIDDEPLALNVIRDFCGKVGFIHLVAACSSAIDAVKVITEKEIDLIFLDIQMPHITGLEFVKTIDNPPLIIFTTAYTEHAIEGFELNAVDYLVKPFSFERFLKAVNKAYELINLKKNKNKAFISNNSSIDQQKNYLMIKVEYKTVRLNLDDILYIEGLKDYIKIYAGVKPILTKSTMKNIMEKLPADRFIRVHKSYIVAHSKINTVENNRILFGEKRIPVGNQYKAAFYKFLESNKL